MNPPGSIDLKEIGRRLYPNLSATDLVNNRIAQNPDENAQIINNQKNKQFSRIRRIEQVGISNRNASRSQFLGNEQIHSHKPEVGREESVIDAESRASRKGSLNIQILGQNEKKVIEFTQRLKNIHHFYRIRIEEERNKNLERNQIFIGIIEDLQRSHNDKLQKCQKSLEQIQSEKRDVNYVDERMESIKSTIEEILTQSSQLKDSNESIEKQIIRKQAQIKQKQQRQITIKRQIEALREFLESCERTKLKQNKRNKELLDIIDDTIDF